MRRVKTQKRPIRLNVKGNGPKRKHARINKKLANRTRKSRLIGGSSRELFTKESIAAERAKTLSLNNVNVKPLKDGLESVYETASQVALDVRDKGISAISNSVTNGVSAGLASAGIDVNNTSKTQGQFDGIYNLVTSDDNQKKFIEIGKDIGKIGIAVGTEILPLATPLIDETISVAETGVNKFIDSAINAGKFGVTSALGPFAGVPLAVMSVVDAGVSVADTGSKLATTLSDTTSAAINVSNRILNEQEKTINRISNTANAFFELPGKQIQSHSGGKTRSCLKRTNSGIKKNKTRTRVKFNRIVDFDTSL